tara:strand:+ start:22525 stop:23448 length:924 start_codon:yes stop_codon:yes gene_type:complete
MANLQNEKYGIFAYIITLFFFASMEALAKYLSETFTVIQIVWARYAFQFILVIIVIFFIEVFGYNTGIKKPKLLKIQIFRSLSLVLMTYCFFASLSKLPLVEATIISFIFPLITVLLSPVLLREKVTFSSLIAVSIGFLGMVVALIPNADFNNFNENNDWFLGILLGIASAFFYSLYQILTRVIANKDSAVTSLLFSGLAGLLLTSIFVIINVDPVSLEKAWKAPVIYEWLFLIFVGTLGAIGQFFILLAYSKARALTLAPISYIHLLWATIFGYLIFNYVLNIQTLFGALLIIFSGIYTYKKKINN